MKIQTLRTFTIILLFLLSVPCLSQQPQKWTQSYTHRHFGIREGLVQAQALYSYQDAYGYMWFSTYDGVSRFDGMHFENYSTEDLRIEIQVQYIDMYETAVYLVSNNNIVFIYPDRTMEFYPLPDNYRVNTFTKSLMPVIGNHLYLFNCWDQSQQNKSVYTILRFDLKEKTYTRLDEDLPFLFPYISDQTIYAVTRNIQNRQLQLYRMDHETLRKVYVLDMEEDDQVIEFKITNKNEWFGVLVKGRNLQQTFHLCRYFVDKNSVRQEYIMPLPAILTDIERLDDHRLILYASSTYILDMDERSLSVFPLDTRTINFITVDRDGVIWFSTDDGVFQCAENFMEYRLGLSRNDDIWGVFRDSYHNVWFSSCMNGFWRADQHGGLHKVDLVHQQKKVSNYFGCPSICEDSRGRIFMTFSNGIAVYDAQKGSPDRLNVIPTGVSMIVYYDATDDAVYFGGTSDSGCTLHALHPDGELSTWPFGLPYIVSIGRNGNQKLRLGTFNSGEAQLDEKTNAIVFDTVPRPYKSAICMASDNNGTLWKGTTEGLFAEDAQGNNRQITNQTIFFVVNYHNRHIIFGTKDKLHLLDLSAFHGDGNIQMRTFGYYDGFDVMECVLNGASIDRDGYVWLAGGDNAISFLPEQIMNSSVLQPCAPYLAAVYKAGRSSGWTLVATTPLMQFENKDNHLRFDFLQASVTAPDKLIFRYRLNGYDDQWQTSCERSIIFQNLSHGKYQFEIQSSTDDGQQWSESVFSPQLAIKPPFILSLPGLILILSGVVIIVVLIVYYTRKIIIRQEEEKRKTDRLRLLAIRSKFIPHFTGNVLNSINYLIQKKPREAQKYISDFSEFSNMTLIYSDFVFRSVQEELEYTELYLKFEKLRFEERLEYDIFVEEDVNLQLPVPCMVILTFCENALKHGLSARQEGGRISVRCYRQNDFTVISVEDNGIGRINAQLLKTEGSREGLKIVQQQIELFNKNKRQKAFMQISDLHDSEGQPSGTRIEMWTPNIC